ncbi:MAG: [NiFe]-hydrogenase assembly chaperone HybE [Devosia sp.]
MSGLGFEGSYLGNAAKIADDAILECKICWMPYEPELGDEVRQIPPGTPFRALPDDWRCPQCDGEKAQFMVADAGTAAPDPMAQHIASVCERLVAEFREVHHAKMRDMPLTNPALHVEAAGFCAHEGMVLGVLVAPWFMNVILMPGPGEDWSQITCGAKELITFPSGTYEFVHNVRPGLGGYKACSLFSPMDTFGSQLQAMDVARAVLPALFDPENRVDDLAGEPEPEPAPAPTVVSPSRRALFTGRSAQAPL